MPVKPPGNEAAVTASWGATWRASDFTSSCYALGWRSSQPWWPASTDGRRSALALLSHSDLIPTEESRWRHDPFGAAVIDEAWTASRCCTPPRSLTWHGRGAHRPAGRRRGRRRRGGSERGPRATPGQAEDADVGQHRSQQGAVVAVPAGDDGGQWAPWSVRCRNLRVHSRRAAGSRDSTESPASCSTLCSSRAGARGRSWRPPRPAALPDRPPRPRPATSPRPGCRVSSAAYWPWRSHAPNSSRGRSRHGIPLRYRWAIASTTRRSSPSGQSRVRRQQRLDPSPTSVRQHLRPGRRRHLHIPPRGPLRNV